MTWKLKRLEEALILNLTGLDDDRYSNIWLSGPAEKVFEGCVQIK